MQRVQKYDSFDCTKLLENFAGMTDLISKMMVSFLDILPSHLKQIDKAIIEKNSSSLAISAHALKGAVSNLYAEPSRLLAWKLEQIGHGVVQQDAMEVFQLLKVELAELTLDLQLYLKGLDDE